jgi:hypothetical protein
MALNTPLCCAPTSLSPLDAKLMSFQRTDAEPRPRGENFRNRKVIPIASMLGNILYSLITMYGICKDNKGRSSSVLPVLTLSASKILMGTLETNGRWPLTQMRKHVQTEHSRETHLRAMAMAMERQNPPR